MPCSRMCVAWFERWPWIELGAADLFAGERLQIRAFGQRAGLLDAEPVRLGRRGRL